MGADIRKHAFYSGHVQGVGFRYTVRALARGHPVRGFVRNLPDGRVDVVAEGPAEAVAALLADVAREMGRYIRDAQVVDEPASGEFDRFTVAF